MCNDIISFKITIYKKKEFPIVVKFLLYVNNVFLNKLTGMGETFVRWHALYFFLNENP